MLPIIGTRYKSNKKHDYDLCQNCFDANGTIEDYTKIDKPLWRPRHFNHQFSGGRSRCPAMSSYYGGRPSFSMRGPHIHGSHGPNGFHGPHGPYAGKGDSRCGGAFGGFGGKLDARFVQDVTIFDGTEFAPGTEFTKIWRLRNSGSCAWPKSTQLVHVGGDALGSVLAVDLVLPEEALGPDGEAEVSVDLVAPEKPGRYVSHWRLVSPTGQKFGHRVWVLIQVVPSDEQSPQMIESLMTSSQEDIEMPEQEAAEDVQAPMTATPQPMEDEAVVQQLVDPFPAADVDILEPVAASKELEVETAPEMVQYPEINMEALTLDAVVVDTGKTQEENTAVENSELGNFSMVNMPTVTEIPVEQVEDKVAPRVAFAVDDESAESEKQEMRKAAEADSVEMTLGALESMGFKQRDLNEELLKKNEYDVQRTVDDLVMAAEWDPMLEELEEMGFYDTDMNRRLMFKNNGSVKRVVKELVQMYKDPKGKEQI
jgi:next-to-BRCA1 protein 1